MSSEVISASSAFSQLDMGSLIAQPLHAVVDAQVQLSLSTVNFIKNFALDSSTNTLRNIVISQESIAPRTDANGNPVFDSSGNPLFDIQQNTLNLPLITLLNVPALQVKKFTIDLTLELLSIQDVSATINTDSITSLSSFGYDNWNVTGGSSGIYRSFARGTSNESSTNQQSIKYAVHLECATTTPPGVTLLLDFLTRNKIEKQQFIEPSGNVFTLINTNKI